MPENCAVGADGELLDTEQIEWFNDPSDDQPIAGPSISSAANKPNAFDRLLLAGREPGAVIAGTHRSGRKSQPSGRLKEAREAASATGKRKSNHYSNSAEATDTEAESDQEPPKKRLRRTDTQSTQPTLSRASTVISNEDDEESDGVEISYEELKKMSEQDKVSPSTCPLRCQLTLTFKEALRKPSKADRTADVWTIFMKTVRKSPSTGEDEAVKECAICK